MRNKDRKLCKTCIYRTHVSAILLGVDKNPEVACFYSVVTGRCRSFICDAENCTVYKKGPQIMKDIPDIAYGRKRYDG